ncbi:porin [Bradyrhizobium sp. AUGA SZCCT0240]|uniref:porin n=1 Tax=unclassified Bradyrhizobium TaxID=2631580 RepID=UPI001BA5C264|nr:MULTISPECIES: porin [unclassified Bradyrhizobium]MBR1199337.1 porin [Bradyrhizobium sp. AUGA SZCCT0158]MBR1241123.1 porin [Bradyrhizobium sp. AUGA SZCCT0274]MBR1246763.1 porin [Bradyrhizobium sp. AUGA SZCCT0169]MBR1255819.1 porin [Bradyrhizobium sp. AUGA SZCCT0240]
MKMVKSLILGSAAGLIAMSGAQAADLPVKAKAVEYVRICSLYGAGFYYIPGTDTCIKLGGYLRVDLALNTNSDYSGQFSGNNGARNRFTNYYTARSRQDINIDTRTATEYGVVRTYFDAVFSWTTGNFAGAGTTPGSSAYSSIAGAQADGLTSQGSLGVYHAFIQFAGFTMGKTISQFDAPWVNYPANNFDSLVGGSGMVTGVNQFTYTAQFGNGVSGTLSAQDVVAYGQAGILNLTGATAGGMMGGTYGVNNTAGTRSPDLIGVLKVDQAWGLFQLSAVAHNNTVGYYGSNETTGHPSNNWGWAVQGALQIKNIPTGAGDTLNLQAVYTDGATRYNIQNLAPASYSMFGSTGLAGAYQSVAFANAPDAVYTGTTAANGSSLENIRTWGFRGGFNHNWDPYWSSGLYGAYAQVKYGNLGRTAVCANAAVLLALVGTCNPDFNVAQAGLITRWTPVKGLTFSADVNWTRIDQKYAGTVVSPLLAAPAKPATVYELRDQDSIVLLLRAQRNW